MIGHPVDSCHVGMSNRAVICELISRIKGQHQGWHNMSRVHRRQVMRAAIKRHQANRDLYRAVMGGRL